jgi:hypothetical protein
MILYSVMQIQNIQGVDSQLTQIIEHCNSTQNRAGYFAALYKRMTAAVINGINTNQFEDGARMDKLDTLFAQRYIDAYNCYYAKSPCSTSWKTAFDCCSEQPLIVLQHLLLGINTHINLDLAIAAAQTCSGNSIYALQNDFNRINSLIASLIADVQECLAEVWFPMRLLNKIANAKQVAVLNFSIDKARDVSWANAVLLANMASDQSNTYIKQMDNSVNIVSNKIKSPGTWTAFLLKFIRMTEYNDVARTINLINTTVV